MARVLVVDDEPDILLLHRVNLEAAGHEVFLAADGERALCRMASDLPDVVLLDVMMPVLDGWAVLEALQSRDDGPAVLVVSARSAPADVERATALGAAGYLTKPFDADDLLVAIDRLTL
ncbi:MAG: response regulator [Acidimicrobiales bacterium]